MKRTVAVGFVLWSCLSLGIARGQEPAPEYRPLTGSFGAGAAFTSGNSDTMTWNLALTLVYDPKTKNVVKADAFYLRGEADDVVNVDRTAAHVRDEYTLTPAIYAFGDLQYLRDPFKSIDRLVAPTAGIGWKAVKTDFLEVTTDVGAGYVWERNAGVDRNSGVWRLGEAVIWKISPTATFSQSAFGLFKMNDSADSLFHFEAALATAVLEHVELKVAVIDEYKRKPVAAEKNDVAGVITLLWKF